MREHGVPQFTVDAHRPVGAFDLLGRRRSRPSSATRTCSPRSTSPASRCTRPTARTTHPIVLAGGHAAFNPEPIADFIDAAVLGDGEEAVLAITDVVRELEARGPPGRPRRAAAAARRAPAACTCRASTTSTTCRTAGSSGSRRTGRACRGGSPSTPSMDLDEWPYPKQPLVPLAETVHERMSVEIFRGCTRGCRFCQAGMITRPVRERSHHRASARWSRRAWRRPASRRSACSSLSSADHSEIAEITKGLADRYEGTQHRPVAAVHPGRRVQHRPRQRAVPQRPPLRADVRPRGRQRADAQGDQQDGHRGGPDPDGRRRVRATAGGR